MALKPEDRPTIENYPPLAKWLDDNRARQAWSVNVNRDAVVSCHVVGTATVLVLVRSRQHGWELYTPCSSNNIEIALADALARISDGDGNGPSAADHLSADVAELRARLAEYEELLANPVITIKPEDPVEGERIAEMLRAMGSPPALILDADPFTLTRNERIELAAAARDGTASPLARAALRRILGEPDPKAGPVDLGITSKSGR